MRKTLLASVLVLAGCSGASTVGTGAGSTTSAATATSTSSSTTGGTGNTGSSSGAGSTSSGSTASTTGAAASSSSTSSTSGTTGSSSGATSGSSGTTGSSGAPLLRFAFTGDTRPATCDDFANYPTTVMQQIASGMQQHNVQFALDTGDHVKVCHTDTTSQAVSSANQQLGLYTSATNGLGKPFYFTMGNHECWDNKSLCDVSDPVLNVFMGFVNQQVQTSTPYYTFDVQTPHGVATFVFVADTAWDSTQATWLESVLTHGDSSAYTIIAKHVPTSNTTDFSTNADEVTIIERHKFALLVDAHAHLYSHAGENGREITLGLGGAPLSNPSIDSYGFGLVEQQSDGTLQVSVIDATTNVARDSFSLAPN